METDFDFAPETTEKPIVYIRQVSASDLPEDIRNQIGKAEGIYAVHDTEGQRLAFVRERPLAFALARQNDMTPVPVH
ncbi:DUF1150 family protein [Alphaproteobacteria bacterium KMM 3653]|uniref:DUF1150 family protein n=1 Tax=Harenicola maris TaxID=2841044 RepID=A0AAP2CQC4_9RHOB|nr:DUF1150 family protein [Harenicola maris]